MILQHSRSLLIALAAAIVCTAQAQDPTSVDIDLRQSTIAPNELEVYIRANDQPFGDVLSALTFTVRWVTTSAATLGSRTNACPEGINIAPTPQVTDPLLNDVPTGFNYRTYNAFGLSLLSDDGCPIPQDEWFLVMTVPVENNGGCTEFNIVNDEWTDSPGTTRDYYISLGGFDKTGTIEETSAFIGDCAADCEGTIGGSALPGTPCDDQNPDTENDLYNDQCACSGLAMTLAGTRIATMVPTIWPNPTSGTLFLNGASTVDSPAMIRVSDALGRLIAAPVTRALNAADTWSIDLSAAPAAVYLIEIDQRGARKVERVVKR